MIEYKSASPVNIASSSLLKVDGVLVQAVYSAVIPGSATPGSLVGEVVEVGAVAAGLSVGDIVVALAPPVPSIALKAGDYQKIGSRIPVTEDMALWALTLALIPVIHLSELEIGERVLVLSNSSIGRILADLVWLAGAGSCIGVGPAFADQAGDISQASHGPQWVKDSTAVESVLPRASVDLLIDASGDSTRFLSGLVHVRNVGRAITIGIHHPSQIDFNVYPDLHRRSIKLFSFRMPTSLSELVRSDSNLDLDSYLAFVRYIYGTGRLQLPLRDITRLRAPNNDTLVQNLQTSQSMLLIEW